MTYEKRYTGSHQPTSVGDAPKPGDTKPPKGDRSVKEAFKDYAENRSMPMPPCKPSKGGLKGMTDHKFYLMIDAVSDNEGLTDNYRLNLSLELIGELRRRLDVATLKPRRDAYIQAALTGLCAHEGATGDAWEAVRIAEHTMKEADK